MRLVPGTAGRTVVVGGGDSGGELFLMQPSRQENNAAQVPFAFLIPSHERLRDARYGILDMAFLDVDVDGDGGGFNGNGTTKTRRLLYSYPRRNADGSFQVVVKEIGIAFDGARARAVPGSSRTWFESQPPVFTQGIHHASGKLARAGDGTVYVSVGDSGSALVGQRLQRPGVAGDLGSIFALQRKLDGSIASRLVSTGHRNIQGLAYDEETGQLLATEHGPQGGDELNLIDTTRVLDYGWPYVSLGIPYESTLQDDKDPRNYVRIARTGTHEGYEPPIHAWTPSIALTEIARLPAMDSYVMGTLREQSLVVFQIDTAGDAGSRQVSNVRFVPVGHRIRSVAVTDARANAVVAATDDGKLVVVPDVSALVSAA